jgi:hypothetical protein
VWLAAVAELALKASRGQTETETAASGGRASADGDGSRLRRSGSRQSALGGDGERQAAGGHAGPPSPSGRTHGSWIYFFLNSTLMACLPQHNSTSKKLFFFSENSFISDFLDEAELF